MRQIKFVIQRYTRTTPPRGALSRTTRCFAALSLIGIADTVLNRPALSAAPFEVGPLNAFIAAARCCAAILSIRTVVISPLTFTVSSSEREIETSP